MELWNRLTLLTPFYPGDDPGNGSSLSGTKVVMRGYFTSRDINEEPRDVRPYLRRILADLTLEQALHVLRTRLERLAGYIGKCNVYQRNAALLLKEFRRSPRALSTGDIRKEFLNEYEKFKNFDLKVQRKAIDVTHTILRKLESKGDSNDALSARQSALIDEYSDMRREVRALHDNIERRLEADFSDADSESSDESSHASATHSSSATRETRRRYQEHAYVSGLMNNDDLVGYGSVRPATSDAKGEKRRRRQLRLQPSMEPSYDSDLGFISDRDDIIHCDDTRKARSHVPQEMRSAVRLGPQGGRGVGSSEYYYSDESNDDFIEDDLPQSRGLAKARRKEVGTVAKALTTPMANSSRYLHDILKAMSTQTLYGLPMDKLYDDDSLPLSFHHRPDGQVVSDTDAAKKSRDEAQSVARVRAESILASHDHNIIAAIDELFAQLEQLMKSSVGSKCTRSDFVSLLHIAEYLWEYYALKSDYAFTAFLSRCCRLELSMLHYLIGSASCSSGQSLNAFLSTVVARCSQQPFGLFTLLRRKTVWITLALHRLQIVARSGAPTLESDRMMEQLSRSLYITGLLLACGIVIFTDDIAVLQKQLLSVLSRRPQDPDMMQHDDGGAFDGCDKTVRLREVYGVSSTAATAFDIIQCSVNLYHTQFGDITHLAATGDCYEDTARGSQIQLFKWDLINAHMLDVQMHFSLHGRASDCVNQLCDLISAISNLSLDSRTEEYPRLCCYLDSQPSASLRSQQRLDHSFWVGIVMHSFVLYSVVGGGSNVRGSGLSMAENWKVVKDITKDVCDGASLSAWLARITSLLPLWSNASAGYDLYRDLTSRLIKDVPWSAAAVMHSRRIAPDDIVQVPTSQDMMALEGVVLECVGVVPSTTLMSKLMTAMFHALDDEAPAPVGGPDVLLSSFDYTSAMIPAVTAIFDHGMRNMSPKGAPFRRIKSRVCRLFTISQSAGSGSEAIRKWSYGDALVLIQVLRSAFNRFGSEVDVYNQTLHDTLLKVLQGSTDTTMREELLVAFTAIFSIYLPAQTCDYTGQASLLTSKGAEYIHGVLMSYLHRSLTLVGEAVASKTHCVACLLAVATCAFLLHGVRARGFRDEDENIVVCIYAWCCHVIGADFCADDCTAAGGACAQAALGVLHEFYSHLNKHVQAPSMSRYDYFGAIRCALTLLVLVFITFLRNYRTNACTGVKLWNM